MYFNLSKWGIVLSLMFSLIPSLFSQEKGQDSTGRTLPGIKAKNDAREVKYQSATTSQDMMELTSEGGKIILKPETVPEFPGGPSALADFIKSNLRYPKEVIKQGKYGVVVVQFTIGVDGTAFNPVITLDKVGNGADEEVKRLIQLMPKWKPATLQNTPVIVTYTQVINFKKQNTNTQD